MYIYIYIYIYTHTYRSKHINLCSRVAYRLLWPIGTYLWISINAYAYVLYCIVLLAIVLSGLLALLR